ncbi:MAG: LCP family protein [Coriobacteriia bacterium]|nr:LCP family protein [Coriobacteriia bacterium]
MRARKKNILIATLVVVFAVLVAAAVSILVFMTSLTGNFQRDLDLVRLSTVLVGREKPADPFWVLLLGTDNYEVGEQSRSDTLILARVDPGQRTVALVSIPRDTYVDIPGYWKDKINAAYAWGGPELAIKTVSEFTGIDIACYVQININGFKDVVDALGGVVVDVPVDVYNNYDWNAPAYNAASPAISKGEEQRLTGEYALLFVRCRNYEPLGDYQRQANQRTFLQAIARQTLASDLLTIIDTVLKLSQMTSTTLSATDITSLARNLRGMKETDIYTYSIPCYSEKVNEIWYEIPDISAMKVLFEALEAGAFPDPDELGFIRQGVVPENYKPKKTTPLSDHSAGNASKVNTADFVVDVRNGCGFPGCATAVSDMLVIAGYQKGEIGNASTWAYRETLIIYKTNADLEAAEDIRARLGFGRIIPSLGRFVYDGDVLVMVGDEFEAAIKVT